MKKSSPDNYLKLYEPKKVGRNCNIEYVKISKNVFYFSTLVSENIKLFKFVNIYYLEKDKKIIFHFLNEKSKTTAKVCYYQNKWVSFSSRGFLSFFNLNASDYPNRYELKKEKIENIGECYVAFLENKN